MAAWRSATESENFAAAYGSAVFADAIVIVPTDHVDDGACVYELIFIQLCSGGTSTGFHHIDLASP
jgi:hypothetical protein